MLFESLLGLCLLHHLCGALVPVQFLFYVNFKEVEVSVPSHTGPSNDNGLNARLVSPEVPN